MRRREFTVSSLAALGLALGGSKSMAQPNPDFKFGVYLGDVMTPAEFDQLVGRPADIVAKFLDITEPFPHYMADLVGPAKKTLAIYWETAGGLDAILEGAFDTHIREFAREAKRYGYPIILSPLHEMNLDEQTWGYSAQNTPSKYKEVWRKLHGDLREATNIKWGLGFNDDAIPSEYEFPDNSYEDYYPGDEYVDYVGISTMRWLSDRAMFRELVDEPYDPPIRGFTSRLPRLKQFGKPIYLWETGCGSDSFEPNRKAEFILSMGEYLLAHPGEIAGVVWLHMDKEEDWRVDDTPASLEAFQTILQRL
jgi:hypothetical protein